MKPRNWGTMMIESGTISPIAMLSCISLAECSALGAI
jgi:hypothetical protein